ncbi:MAG: NAD(P)H-dependent oxidoreductase subunit E, partial [Candidatus Omnitrophica bacterium]|nr:NAD(P)H-dependent oxidoreductase subunit E [Candidatus Omnitrophota bacterium]
MNILTVFNIKKVCGKYKNDPARLMDIVNDLHKEKNFIGKEEARLIANEVGLKLVEVESLVSFYGFFSQRNKGKYVVRVCNDVVDKMKGFDEVAEAFQKDLGVGFGETTPDGAISLEQAPCIGMCDQAPAAIINEVVFTNLTSMKVADITGRLKKKIDPRNISTEIGDGNNAHPLIKSMVKNNIVKKGEVIFAQREAESGLKKAISLLPEEIVSQLKTSKLRGRGGAGFPTGMKWDFTRQARGDKKYVLCNADEGEPGTFKDRVLLTECADLVFEGMTIGGYAIGAEEGVLYLRGEYAYLRNYLESKLAERRQSGLLGKNILGKQGFNFEIRIQSGAGAYICGEETALISSCEGLRGDPKTRPPFPAQKGYLKKPTTVNNVETFCCVSRIMEKGASWFSAMGTPGSPGTKLLSVSGDCEKPGVYELPFGTKVSDLFSIVGATNTKAVLVGGPSGQIIGASEFGRIICYDDLATGGAIVIFNKTRDLLEVAKDYMEFFVEESCGYCTPCRAGN